jgi:hypothetical protein
VDPDRAAASPRAKGDDPIKMGYVDPTVNSTFYPKHYYKFVELTCYPASDLKDVKVEIGGAGCAALVDEPKVHQDRMTVTFKLKGIKPTDPNNPNGTWVQASVTGKRGKTVTAKKVVQVLVPSSVAWPASRAKSFTCVPKKMLVSPQSYPPYWFGSGWCWVCETSIRVQVLDQFNHSLQFYDGEEVIRNGREYNGGKYKILKDTGQFLDVIVAVDPDPPAGTEAGCPAVAPQYQDPVYAGSRTWNFPITIGGHNVQITGRTVKLLGRGITVLWNATRPTN